jgi:hypothetical protein
MIDWIIVRPATTTVMRILLYTEDTRKRTVPNAVYGLVREDTLLVEVGPIARLLNQRGRKAMGICLVVSQLVIHEVIDL